MGLQTFFLGASLGRASLFTEGVVKRFNGMGLAWCLCWVALSLQACHAPMVGAEGRARSEGAVSVVDFCNREALRVLGEGGLVSGQVSSNLAAYLIADAESRGGCVHGGECASDVIPSVLRSAVAYDEGEGLGDAAADYDLSVGGLYWSGPKVEDRDLLSDALGCLCGAKGGGFRPELTLDVMRRRVAESMGAQFAYEADSAAPLSAIVVEELGVSLAWTLPFDESRTVEAAFVDPGGGVANVSLMRRDGHFELYSASSCQVLRLRAYGGYSLLVVLPSDGVLLSGAVAHMEGLGLNKVLEGMNFRPGSVGLPRMRLLGGWRSANLGGGSGPAAGRAVASDGGSGDEVGFLTECVLELDEKGVNAGRVTWPRRLSRLITPVPFEFQALREFGLLLVDDESSLVIAIGYFAG